MWLVIRISNWKLQKHDITSTVFLESLCVFNVLLWFSGRARCWKNPGDGDQISCKPRCCRLPVCDAGAGYQRWTRSAREAKHLEALWLVSLMAGIGSWPPFLEGGGCCFFVTSCFFFLSFLLCPFGLGPRTRFFPHQRFAFIFSFFLASLYQGGLGFSPADSKL